MRINPLSASTSMEVIDYQKDNFFQEFTHLFSEFKEDHISEKSLKDRYKDMIKKRFNINVTLTIQEVLEPNAYMIPYELNESNILSYRRLGQQIAGTAANLNLKKNKAIMIKVAKGDLDSIGLLDYRKAVVNGLFAQLPPAESAITRGALNMLSPEEMAAVMLHEIGHFWTYLEFLGLNTCRNAIIANTVNEYLGAKSEEEKFQIILEVNNAFKLNIDENLTKVSDEKASKVICGSMTHCFGHATGYVQYDDNTSEVIADQFSVRMGAGAYLSDGLNKIFGKTRHYSRYIHGCVLKFALVTAIAVVTAAVTAMIAPLLSAVAGMVAYLTGQITVSIMVNSSSGTNGSAYDLPRDRIKRIYNETLGALKKSNVTPHESKVVLDQLKRIQNVVANTSNDDTIFDKLWRIFSSNFREQEKKKLYQQLTEELLANELYVTSAKFKTLGA